MLPTGQSDTTLFEPVTFSLSAAGAVMIPTMPEPSANLTATGWSVVIRVTRTCFTLISPA